MKQSQRGATAVEFALVLVMYLAVLLAILDFSRMLFMWNAANEATRAGARYAVACTAGTNTTPVRNRMQALLPQIQTVSVAWDPPSCDPSSCVGVRVGITGLNFTFMSPIAGLASVGVITMPNFSTYVTREDMGQDTNTSAFCP